MKTHSKLAISVAALLLSACSSTSTNQSGGWLSGWLPPSNPMGTPDMVSSRQPSDYYKMIPSTDE